MKKPVSISGTQEFRVLSTTAILGYGFPEKSFLRGMARKPHLIAADAGSTDPGPYYLGAGKSFTNRDCVKRDLRYMLVHGVRNGIPVVVGSAGGSGARPHLDWCRKIIEEIAREEKLHFRLGVISADIPTGLVLKELRRGRVQPLSFVPKLSTDAVRESTHIVAQMGVEPLIRAIKAGCDVVLAGRCYDPACFAALPIMLGYDPGLALHMGKILECAAIAASPGSGADCALGVLKEKSFILESLNPARKFTKLSTAAHTLYEKSDPYHLPGPGGAINLERCRFTELTGGRVEVSGSKFEPSEVYRVKLEGARRIGFRTISMSATRDPVMISKIDEILESVRATVDVMLTKGKSTARIFFHVYGKNAVMGGREPLKNKPAHELGILIESLADTKEQADSACSLTRSTLLHFGYPGRISTAGNLAFPFSPSDVAVGDAYEFSIYHLMELNKQDVFKMMVREL